MKNMVAALALCVVSGAAWAAEMAPNFKASRIQVVEGSVSATIGCDVLPSNADVARMALDVLESQKAAIGEARQITLLPTGGKPDPAALKIAFDIHVVYEIYNSTDGPRASEIDAADKVWSGASQVYPGEVELQPWNTDVGCGDDVTYAVQDIVKQSILSLTKRMK